MLLRSEDLIGLKRGLLSTGSRSFKDLSQEVTREPGDITEIQCRQKFCVNFILEKNSHGKIPASIRTAIREKVRK